MTDILTPDDPRLAWYGAVSFERGDGWIKPWRIPFEKRLLFGTVARPDRLLSRAGMPSGVRIAFLSDTRELGLRLEPLSSDDFMVEQARTARMDVCINGSLHESIPLADRVAISLDLPGGEKLIEVWLPEYREVRLRSISIDDGATIHRYDDTRPRWLIYGSSNTQCRGAESPFFTWPAIAARQCGLNLTNLAYGGECHLDSMVARMMRDLSGDFVAMEIGINIYIEATLNARALRAALMGFAQILRDGHPYTPIILMSSIYSPGRESTPNAAGLTLQDIRSELAMGVADLTTHGDRNFHYVNGLDLFGEDMALLLPDNLHPSGEGYKILGDRFATQVMPRFFPSE